MEPSMLSCAANPHTPLSTLSSQLKRVPKQAGLLHFLEKQQKLHIWRASVGVDAVQDQDTELVHASLLCLTRPECFQSP